MKNKGFDNIVDFLQMKLQELPLQPHGIIYREAAEYLADALIAAEIGDVGELRHRAEVAEKALYNACRISAAIPTKEFVSARVDCFLKQAEKELQEEKER